MKRKGLLKGLLLIAAELFVFHGRAQDSFAYRAPLDTISQAGFYRIILTPQLVAKCREDMADIRIHAEGSSYIPYVLKTDFPITQGESFIEFPILPAKKEDSAGDVRIGNWSGGAINSLLLYMHMTSVVRNWTLSGSNDGEKWFAIREHIRVPITGWQNDSEDHSVIVLDFPKSNYRYFKIIQENKGMLPVNIYRVGVTTQHAGNQLYRPTPPPMLSQKDSSNHHSYITLSFPEPYLVEYLKLDIKGPRLYRRQARLMVGDDPGMQEPITLDPVSHSFHTRTSLKLQTITLDIDNEDNAPLVVEKVETSQKERYLLTWLEPGKYELLVGDRHAQTPVYDLKYFVDTVSQEPAAIMPGIPTATNIHPLTPIVKPRDNKGVYLWSAIVVVLVLLVWLCLNMLKSIRESRQ